jgi:hypothetical protein
VTTMPIQLNEENGGKLIDISRQTDEENWQI